MSIEPGESVSRLQETERVSSAINGSQSAARQSMWVNDIGEILFIRGRQCPGESIPLASIASTSGTSAAALASPRERAGRQGQSGTSNSPG